MLYIFAIFFPPIAILFSKNSGIVSLLLNVLLCLFFYFPGIIHALYVTHEHYADKRLIRQQIIIRSKQ